MTSEEGQDHSRSTVTSRTFMPPWRATWLIWLLGGLLVVGIIGAVSYYLVQGRQPTQLATATGNTTGAQPATLKGKATAELAAAKTAQQKAIAYEDLGNAYLNTNDPKNAIIAFRQALNYDAHNIGILSELTSTYLEVGNKQQAISLLNQSVAILGQSKTPDARALVAQYKNEIAQLKGMK